MKTFWNCVGFLLIVALSLSIKYILNIWLEGKMLIDVDHWRALSGGFGLILICLFFGSMTPRDINKRNFGQNLLSFLGILSLIGILIGAIVNIMDFDKPIQLDPNPIAVVNLQNTFETANRIYIVSIIVYMLAMFGVWSRVRVKDWVLVIRNDQVLKPGDQFSFFPLISQSIKYLRNRFTLHTAKFTIKCQDGDMPIESTVDVNIEVTGANLSQLKSRKKFLAEVRAWIGKTLTAKAPEHTYLQFMRAEHKGNTVIQGIPVSFTVTSHQIA